MEEYFPYGEKELSYLRKKDKRLAEVIDKVGMVERRVVPDLFTALVHSIVGQQISAKAHESIWRKIVEAFGTITPEAMAAMPPEELQKFGLSFRKVDYIQSAAKKILSGEFDIDALRNESDEEVCQALGSLDGVGKWTAEMLMIHSLLRPDVLSYGDLGIQRGMRMLYHHRKITPALFEKYRRRYSPYATVAGIYLWEISAGKVEGMKDYAPKIAVAGRKSKGNGI